MELQLINCKKLQLCTKATQALSSWKQGSFGGTKRNGVEFQEDGKKKKGGEGVEVHEKHQKKTKLMARPR